MTTVMDSLTDLTVIVGGAPLRPEDVVAVARHGTGAEVEREVVRALQLLRLQTLATGHTGVRPAVVE
ncbi:MAG TPA: aromatic amino acid lyase, partial [Microbacterium sp.]|nr:aromatic amino acid lyase [Microbacterium sp.]